MNLIKKIIGLLYQPLHVSLVPLSSPHLTMLTCPVHLKSVFFCVVLFCVSGGGAEVTAVEQ